MVGAAGAPVLMTIFRRRRPHELPGQGKAAITIRRRQASISRSRRVGVAGLWAGRAWGRISPAGRGCGGDVTARQRRGKIACCSAKCCVTVRARPGLE